MPLLLVRHAQALSRSSWTGDDRERSLSERGRKQSQGLVQLLREFKPGRVLSSPYLRCVETVVPTATALGLQVEIEDVLAEGAGRGAVELVRSLAGDDVVLCSHGDIIPEVLGALSAEERVDVGRNPRHEKASVWVLEGRKGRFVKAKYLRPPS